MNDGTCDRDLIIRMQAGDLDALGDLYDRYRFVVFRTAVAINGDVESASDLLQDVFLRLYRFSDRIDPDRPIQPWLYRMTANLAYTLMKRERNWFRLLTNFVDSFSSQARNPPAETAETSDDWDHLQKAIANLPFNQRIVIIHYYLNDLSLQEIAEVLEIPEGTVKSRLHYGRNALKKAMGLAGLLDFNQSIADLPYEI